MEMFYRYNWMVREEWFKWCEKVPEEELLKERTGGVGGILHTLFHIVDVEWSWIQIMKGEPDFQESFDDYRTLALVRDLSAKFHDDVKPFVLNWTSEFEENVFEEQLFNGEIERSTWGEIMRHVIAHEIHHIGQLSIWSREIGVKPVSANLLWRDLASSQIE
ncbi:DinB family protein [Chungangia koreensis]|uniref:DinB family protein n=1 Tax=Chungangia koreensis TaxID=752657 RepID=A0ABV8X4A6_9LACT